MALYHDHIASIIPHRKDQNHEYTRMNTNVSPPWTDSSLFAFIHGDKKKPKTFLRLRLLFRFIANLNKTRFPAT